MANLAHKAGLPDIRATPSVALGAYNVTPLEIAGAYTIFSNNGVSVTPRHDLANCGSERKDSMGSAGTDQEGSRSSESLF